MPHPASTRNRLRKPCSTAGFTLIELMIVATTLSVLASMALANFSDVKARAYIVTIQSDLKNIWYAQELFFQNNYTYAQATPLLREYSPSPEVILVMVATAEGWTAKGTHKANPAYQCAVFSGTVLMNFAPSTVDGAIACIPKQGGGIGPGAGGGGGGGGGGPGGGGPGGGGPGGGGP